MKSLYVVVRSRGNGYIAQSRIPAVAALGSTAEEAAEGARLTALRTLDTSPRPRTIIVRIDAPGRSIIVMQPIDNVISLGRTKPVARRRVDRATFGAIEVAE